ncbi:unnamed protein product, partial [Dicrocoelium dendriticum]
YLRVHEKSVHLRERPHKCKYCEKTFSQLGNRRIHEHSIHLKQLPYTCEHCGKSFSAKVGLQRHRSYVHSSECSIARSS